MISLIGVWVVPAAVGLLLMVALLRRVPLFAEFTCGVKEGAAACLRIFPTLIGLVTAITMLRASGALDLLAQLLQPITSKIGLPSELVPLVLLRPVSGGGSIALLQELLQQCGADSFAGRVAAVMAGSTETTFYTIAVYYGAVGVKKMRYTLPAALTADCACVLCSLLTVRLLHGV